MREFSLCKELSVKLAKDLGASPFSIGKTSLTHIDLITNINLSVCDEDNETATIPVWYGETKGIDGIICCLLAGLDSNPDSLEIACVLGFKDFDGGFQADGVRISFHYDWTNDQDPGTLVMKAGDKWIPLSLSQRLQLILGFETMIQDGVMWQKSGNIPDLLQRDLAETIEIDEKSD